MKHNGNLKVGGRLSSKKIIVGDFSGITPISGSYELPYPIGEVGTIYSVVEDVSGNKKVVFVKLDATINTYTPTTSADWSLPLPTNTSEALDTLASNLNSHNHKIENLSTDELDITYIMQPDGVGGVLWKPSDAINLTNYYTKTEVNSISGYLQSEIDSLNADVVSISANLGSKTFESLSDTPGSYVGHASEFVTVNATETGLDFTPLISGALDCNLIDQAYVITHPKLTANSLPMITVSIPTSGDTQYVASPTNMRGGAFDVVLSGVPMVTGYRINWFSFNNN